MSEYTDDQMYYDAIQAVVFKMPEDSVIDWSKYRFDIEEMSAEDGGGYRAWCEKLGMACYGVGDTPMETWRSLHDSKLAMEAHMRKRPSSIWGP